MLRLFSIIPLCFQDLLRVVNTAQIPPTAVYCSQAEKNCVADDFLINNAFQFTTTCMYFLTRKTISVQLLVVEVRFVLVLKIRKLKVITNDAYFCS